MNKGTYLVTKVCQQCWRITVVQIGKPAEQGGKRRSGHLCVTGNLPALYPQMILSLELNGTEVVDYDMELTEKNRSVLQKHGINQGIYTENLANHRKLKEKGFTWEKAKVRLDMVYEKFSFREADMIHREIVNNAADTMRLDAISRNIIRTGREHRKIIYSMEEFFRFFDSIEEQGAYERLIMPLKQVCLQADCFSVDGGMICDTEMKRKEDFVIQNVTERVQNGNYYQLLTSMEIDDFIMQKQDSGLADEQLYTVNCLFSSVPSIITGGAGTGKTSVIKTLIECYAKYYGTSYILLTAPTGKAGRRLAEKTGFPACTIHKALRKNPEDDYIYYNEYRQMPYRLIIVDESSMVDMELMYDLLKATNRATKIVFVGDCNQLYPVGYGEPFFRFMNIMDAYYLQINHRQSEDTDILRVANNTLRNIPVCNGRGVTVREISEQEIDWILESYMLEDDYMKSSQIISPFNQFNAEVNRKLRKGDAELNVGDKIMTIRNTKDYSNGDIGMITAVDEAGFTLQINNNTVKVPVSHKDDITLAYAITVHKMQGSESERVIVFIPKNSRMLSVRMLYTAFTRAKNELMIYYY